MVEGTIYYYKNFVHQKMKHPMLPIFITMWFINWIWGRLGKRKIKRSILLLCFTCWRRSSLDGLWVPQGFFCFFKLKNMPKKHWFNNLGWEMAGSIYDVVLECTKEVIKEFPFLAISTNEITTSDTKCWISIHGYILENWQWIPILLNLEKVTNGVIVEKIYNVILQTLLIQKGLIEAKIKKKLVSIKVNGGSMFVGCRTSVSMQMKEKLAPYLVAVHCCAHCTNLAIQTLSSLSIVHHMEDLL